MTPESPENDSRGSRQFSIVRKERLLRELERTGSVSVSEFSQLLDVSEMTVRRDINDLARRGLVTRVHGGATVPSALDRSLRPDTVAGSDISRWAVGMVVPSLDYYWPQVVNGARVAASQAHTRLILRGSRYSAADNRKQIQALIETPGVRGIIAAPEIAGSEGRKLLHWLMNVPLPIVLMERRPTGLITSPFESVVTNHAYGSRKAITHLAALGHQRIGLLVSETSPHASEVRRGWVEATRMLGHDPSTVVHDDANLCDGPDSAAFMDRILDQCRRTGVTALLIHADQQAVRFQQFCLDSGIRIPDDFAIVAYDDEVAHMTIPAISAVRPPKKWVGKSAVELLIARLEEGDERPRHHLQLEPDLIVRESSGRRNPDDTDDDAVLPLTTERS